MDFVTGTEAVTSKMRIHAATEISQESQTVHSEMLRESTKPGQRNAAAAPEKAISDISLYG